MSEDEPSRAYLLDVQEVLDAERDGLAVHRRVVVHVRIVRDVRPYRERHRLRLQSVLSEPRLAMVSAIELELTVGKPVRVKEALAFARSSFSSACRSVSRRSASRSSSSESSLDGCE